MFYSNFISVIFRLVYRYFFIPLFLLCDEGGARKNREGIFINREGIFKIPHAILFHASATKIRIKTHSFFCKQKKGKENEDLINLCLSLQQNRKGMKKGLFLLLFIAYGAMTICAQVIDNRLTNLVPRPSKQIKAKGKTVDVIDTAAVKRDINVTFNSDGTIDSIYAIAHLVPGAPCPTAELESRGIRVKLVVGPIAILSMKPEKLYELEDIETIERVAVDQMNYPMNDRARSKTEVTSIDGTDTEAWTAAGFSGTGYYTGKGVIVGMVDTGIEFNHIAFKKSDGTSRVKEVVTGKPNLTTYKTTAEIAALTTDNNKMSHGSHTSATAAGSVISDYATRNVRGMAPEADLVLCGLNDNLSDARIIEAITEVFSYADEVDKPAVVNVSLGNTVGIKDDQDAIAKVVSELTLGGTKPGRIVVFSAGNSGGEKMSISEKLPAAGGDGYNLRTLLTSTNTQSVTVNEVKYTNTYYGGLEVFTYVPEGGSFTCDLKVVDKNTGTVYTLAEKPIYKYVDSTTETPYTSASSFIISAIVNGKHKIEVKKSEKLFFKETGLTLALFINGTEGQTINMICKDKYNNFSNGGLAGFTDGSSVLSMNNMVCNDAVISVGAYVSRPSWTSITGRTIHYINPWLKIENGIAVFSSYGTDDRGINRPDILAPGAAMLSAYNGYDINFFTEREPNASSDYASLMTDCITKNETKYYYGDMEGTSMAAPTMTGIIALWLQQDPTLSVTDIRRLLRITADNDEYTTNTENIPSGSLVQAGMGKANALKGMKRLALTAPTEVALGNTTDNSETITTYNGTEVNATLSGRTFYKDGAWNTLCLPFDVTISESPLNGDGVKVMTLDTESSNLSDGTLTLNFTNAGQTIEAGKPYLIRWTKLDGYVDDASHNIVDPTFRYVTMDADASTSVSVADVLTMQGIYSPYSIGAEGDRSILYLGNENKLYYPSGARTIHAQRAYFQLADGITVGDSQNEAKQLRVVMQIEDGEATLIEEVQQDAANSQSLNGLSDTWYTLDGRQLTGKPRQKGIYLYAGRKFVIQ